MRRLRFLLRPGWLALALVVVAFAYVCFTQLAPWQLGKNTQTEQRNELISASFDQPPVPLTELVAPGRSPTPEQEWRVVTVTGRYLPDTETFARLRTVQGKPAYEVLSAFATDGGATVLVNRGWVRPDAGTRAPEVEAAPEGTVTLPARLRRDESGGDARPSGIVDGVPQVYAVNAGTVGELTGLTVTPGYLQLADGAPGVLGVLPLPQLESGPYLSYGLQWLAFGLMAPLGLAYFVRAELRERRRGPTNGVEPEPELDPVTGGGPELQAATTREATLADRYGRGR